MTTAEYEMAAVAGTRLGGCTGIGFGRADGQIKVEG